MNSLVGIPYNEVRLDEFEWVGDLVYFDGPFVSVFEKEKSAYIWKWAERGTDCHRWIVYEVDVVILSQFVYGQISHYHLLSSPKNGVYFVIDIAKEQEVLGCKIVPKGSLPIAYFPKRGAMFDESLCEDTTSIISHFNLSRPEKNISDTDLAQIIESESRHANSELFDIRLKGGQGFDQEYPNAGKIGILLTAIQEISTQIAYQIYKDSNRRNRLSKKDRTKIEQWSDLSWYGNRAASFVVLLRPRSPMIDINNRTSTEKIAKILFELFNLGLKGSKSKESFVKFSNDVLSSYRKLLVSIQGNEFEVEFGWTNAQKNLSKRAGFNPPIATKIISQIDSVYEDDPDYVEKRGYFHAIDTDAHTFKFITNQDEKYTGKFDNLIKEGTKFRNFETYYEVKMRIVYSRKAGNPEKVNEDVTMIACYSLDLKDEEE